MGTTDNRTGNYGFHSNSFYMRHHHHHHRHHPYKRSEYFLEDFKKVKPPTFDGDMKKSKGLEVWFLGMKKIFRLDNYSENIKAKIATFSRKGKTNIWWEDVRNVKGIREEQFILDEFKSILKENYIYER